MKIRLLLAIAGVVTGFGAPTIAQQKVSTSGESTPEGTRTLEDYDTQVLPDRHVIFRLLAPQANDVKVLMGVTSSALVVSDTLATFLGLVRSVPCLPLFWAISSTPR